MDADEVPSVSPVLHHLVEAAIVFRRHISKQVSVSSGGDSIVVVCSIVIVPIFPQYRYTSLQWISSILELVLHPQAAAAAAHAEHLPDASMGSMS